MKQLFRMIKNTLSTPDSAEAFKTANGLSVSSFGRTELVVRALKDSKLLDFFIVVAGSIEGKMFMPHATVVCEIFNLIFSAYNPNQIAAGPEFNKLALVEDLENERPIQKPIRHSNFSGSIVFRLSTGQDYVLRQGSNFNDVLDLDLKKTIKRQGGRRYQPLSYHEYGSLRKGVCSQQDILLISKLADDFLASCFNVLFRHLFAEELLSRSNSDRFNWTVLRLCTWFLMYVRALPNKIKVSSVYAVLRVEPLLEYGKLLRRFHLESKTNGDILLVTIVFFREVLRTVEFMLAQPFDGSDASDAQHQAAVDIQNALFYQMDILQTFRLILHENQRQTKQGLMIVVETVHLLMELLERYSQGRSAMYVQKKMRSKAKLDSDAESEDERTVEKRFDFNGFIGAFATEPILLAYSSLLSMAVTNSTTINRYLAVMFYRLYKVVHAEHLFYKVHFLDAAHKFLKSPSKILKQNQSLESICLMITKGFFAELRSNQLLVIEALFPYSAHDHIDRQELLYPDDESIDGDYNSSFGKEDEMQLPESLSRDQKLRTVIHRLFDQEMNIHVAWLCTLLESIHNVTDSESYLIQAESESQKKALRSPSFCTLLRLINIRPPTAMIKYWHVLPTCDIELMKRDVEYIRMSGQDLLNEAEPQALKFSSFKKQPVESENEVDFSDDILSEESFTGSDFSIQEELEKEERLVSPEKEKSKMPQASTKNEQSKWSQMLKSGYFTEAQDGDALPLTIENDEELEIPDHQDKKPKRRIIDSDDE